MKSHLKHSLILFLTSSFISFAAHAGKCGEYVFKGAWWGKYKYAMNTPMQNINKYGFSTTTQYVSETITAITDPGVTTGALSSSVQWISSWGPCSFIDGGLFGSHQRQEYIKDNLDEIKRQIALGKGPQLKTLTFIYGCGQDKVEQIALTGQVRKGSSFLFDLEKKDAKRFDQHLVNQIKSHPKLKNKCDIKA